MTKDEIIDMANKAGFDLTMWQLSLGCEVSGTHDELLAFAKLLAEAESEACIVDIQMNIPRSGGSTREYQMAMRMIERIRARGKNETKSHSPHEIL